MKRYRSPREVLAEVDKVLAGRATVVAPFSLLDQTLDILYRSRHYLWIGFYLTTEAQAVRLAFRGEEADPGSAQRRPEFDAPVKIGRRELGVIEVESDREHAFGRDERVLLQRVASRLALYLATRGKHILRRLRDQKPPEDNESVATAAEPRVDAKKSARPLKPVSKPSGRVGALRSASGATTY